MRHLRDIPIDDLGEVFAAAGVPLPETQLRRVKLAIHRHGARNWTDLPLRRERRERLQRTLRFGPLLETIDAQVAEDGTRKLLLRNDDGHAIEAVLLRNAKALTACLSSQAGCALACTFCATGELGLLRHLTPGEITESFLALQEDAGARISDVVFMGQGEPLHNYDAVMQACEALGHTLGAQISYRRITVSTSGLVPAIERYTDEARPWRLHLSLHAAVQKTRAALMPIAKTHPLSELVAAMRRYQAQSGQKWVTLQYVAIPDVNMDDAHVDALGEAIQGLRAIVNVIPYNDTGAGYRPPTWGEVKRFTTSLRRLDCPVKIRYSGGKKEGMGCGQLAAGHLRVVPRGGHVDAPAGIFTA